MWVQAHLLEKSPLKFLTDEINLLNQFSVWTLLYHLHSKYGDKAYLYIAQHSQEKN